jgi:hypothetical protein
LTMAEGGHTESQSVHLGIDRRGWSHCQCLHPPYRRQPQCGFPTNPFVSMDSFKNNGSVRVSKAERKLPTYYEPPLPQNAVPMPTRLRSSPRSLPTSRGSQGPCADTDVWKRRTTLESLC